MPTIRQLPQGLINKIAAGEVIERPASVVKELMENSVDAGATSIELTIEGGGIDMIRISDNGCGISAEQIPLAVASHATSKLETADDLFDVHTLGFRGEALASIAEISHFSIKTRIADDDAGSELSVRGGEKTAIVPVGCPVGTCIEIRNLFFNTPVRRKFLRTPQTEAGHITEAFTRIALAFPQVHFVMKSGNRTTYDLPATESWQERIRAFFGDEIADSLIAVDSSTDEASLNGFVVNPSVSRSNNRMQYIFLNGRHIRDRSLQHALAEAYRGLLMVGRFPICFLRLTIPANQVDVNVHPTKMEVRFAESGKLYSQLLKTLRHEFLTTDLTARAKNTPGPMPAGLRDKPAATTEVVEAPVTQADERRWEDHSDAVTQIGTAAASSLSPSLGLRDTIPDFRPFAGSGSVATAPAAPAPSVSPSVAEPAISDSVPPGAQAWQPDAPTSSELQGEQTSEPAGNQEGSQGAPEDTLHTDADHIESSASAPMGVSHLGFQIHNRYLVSQDESGMVIVDQHALHERILYERFRARTESEKLESQKLLVPEPLDLTANEAAAALEHREMLDTIGMEVDAFGGDTVLLTSYPAMLGKLRPAEILRQVLEPLLAGGKSPDPRELLDELLNLLACKAAIKAGDKLSGNEITALLEQRALYDNTHHCPHGRPTMLHFSREHLDKMFKRT